MKNLDNTQPVLSDSKNLYTYRGTTYTDEVDTRFPPDEDDIDVRFGASTNIAGYKHGRSANSDHTFSTGYQSSSGYKGRTDPPRGIFDDV